MGRPSANLDGHGHGLAGQATRSGHRIPGKRGNSGSGCGCGNGHPEWVYLYVTPACVMCELLHLLLMQFINYLAERPAGCHC